VFASARESLRDYLSELPQAELERERRRLEYVAGSREYLIQLMKYMPFGGEEGEVLQLQDGRKIRGSIPFCNELQLAIRPVGAATEDLQKVSWSGFPFEQYVAFFDYYLEVRSSLAGNRRDAGEDALRLALLCDWYGRRECALVYAQKAVAFDPVMAGRLQHLFPGCVSPAQP
jgi:hypothetical protein